jgi:hypothetical protein
MRTIRDTHRSDRDRRGSAKSEGKIKVDGTCVRRNSGLHEGRGGTRAMPRVPLPKPSARCHSKFRVPSTLQRALPRRNMRCG